MQTLQRCSLSLLKMEDENKKVVSSKSTAWIECESKSRPNQKYVFNTATGESKWVKLLPSPVQASKLFSAPANDRLKRLQTELQRAKPLNKKSEQKRSTTIKSQKPPTTSKKTILTAALPLASAKDRLKVLKGKAIKERLGNTKPEPHGSLNSKSKAAIQPEIKNTTQTEELVKRKAQKRCATQPVETNKPKLPAKKESLSKVQKIQKSIPKSPKDHPKAIESVIPHISIENNSIIDTLKTSKRLSHHQKTKTPEIIESEVPNLKFLTETPNNNYPSVKRLKCSANQRLERFRKSLNENIVVNQSFNSIENSLNSLNVEYEAMEWEPTEELKTTWSGFDSTVVSNNCTFDEPTHMQIDANLMLVAAEENQKTILEEKWHKSSVYVVLDTNIFIHHLSFIEELRTKKIIDAPGIVLYIPYGVLQELDKLKLRENIKTPVVRAIRYLNKIFEEKYKCIQTQSALEERKHLIDVDSSDDSILNCCLQIQAHVPNVILLSEDVNLKNKAMCNNIAVSTKSNLLAKKYNFPIGGLS